MDEVKSQRAVKTKYIGDDFHEWAIFKVCMLEVIDTSIKKERRHDHRFKKLKRHHSSNLKSRIFLRKVRQRSSDTISAFQITRATLSKISDKVENAWRLLSQLPHNFCLYKKRRRNRVVHSEIEEALAQKSKRRLFRNRRDACSEIEEAFVQKSKRRLLKNRRSLCSEIKEVTPSELQKLGRLFNDRRVITL